MTSLYISELGRLGKVRLCGRARTAQGAMSGISQEKPHVVILDLALAEGTGLEVLRACRKQDDAPVFLVVSNHPELRAECERLGAKRVFDKATGFLDLLEYIPVCAADHS